MKIQLVFLLFNTALAVVNRLPQYEDLNINDFNPELVGKYHTAAFNALKDKYETDSTYGRPSELSQVLDDMKDILLAYCSSPKVENTEENSCAQSVQEYVNKGSNYFNELDRRSTSSLFEDDQMERLEQALKNVETKEIVLKEISSLKEDINTRNEKDRKIGALMALSIAEESFSLWYDVYADDEHPFRYGRNAKNGRRLQGAICLDIFEIVSADIDGGTDALQDGESFDQVVISAVLASVNKFFQGCGTPTASPTSEVTIGPTVSQMPTNSVLPSITPSISSSPSLLPSQIPSTSPSVSHMPSSLDIPSSSPSTPAPSKSPSEEPSLSHSPTFGVSTLNKIITCVSIIDESYELSENFFRDKWNRFREFFPDRPFCLLQPAIFTTSEDENTYGYADIDVGTGIKVPDEFYSDDKTIFSSVKRDLGNSNQLSDWFDICDLAGLREEGVSRVAFFIDESGSMDRTFVQASFDLFAEKIDNEGIEVVGAIYNNDEDWIEPFLTNFGFDGPVIGDDDIFCRGGSFMNQMKGWLKRLGNPNPY